MPSDPPAHASDEQAGTRLLPIPSSPRPAGGGSRGSCLNRRRKGGIIRRILQIKIYRKSDHELIKRWWQLADLADRSEAPRPNRCQDRKHHPSAEARNQRRRTTGDTALKPKTKRKPTLLGVPTSHLPVTPAGEATGGGREGSWRILGDSQGGGVRRG
jgi:hypothetical protein